jgi:hypothetical protein
MNIHAPERQADETFEGYKERRATSKAMYKESRRGRRVKPNDPATFFVTVHKASPQRKTRRDAVRLMGVRQYKKTKREAV